MSEVTDHARFIVAAVMPELDEFGRRLQSTAARRMTDLRGKHQRESQRRWAEMLVCEFGDHELTLLDQLGFLSHGDRMVLHRYRRTVRRLAKVADQCP